MNSKNCCLWLMFVFVGKDFASFQGCKNKYDAVARNIALVKPKASVIVAWGESGAAGQVSGGEVVDSPACPPPAVVDTLGAGDTFLAATIVCLSQGYDLRQSIAAGCRVAGAKVGASGFSAVHPQLIQLPMNS
ncbi:ketohexokinase-like [Homalodisca vitripennis]|uniref:ketohexokinase-like n=1 Tax=Homalodisca vitripennis TaxID=197043 RepID=UPI001EEC7E80|nr:ketohexokinase-like [Homalodisca vitripennis]